MEAAVVGGSLTESAQTNSNDRRRPSQKGTELAVQTLIEWAGDSPKRDGLAGTPERVVRAYEDFFATIGRLGSVSNGS